MEYILLALATFTLMIQNVLAKLYEKKTNKGVLFFNAFTSLFSAIFFLFVCGFNLAIEGQQLLYSFGFAISFMCAVIGVSLSLRAGPISVTSVVLSYSLILPSVYGIIFLNEPITPLMIVGFSLIAISLVLTNLVKQTDEFKISWKWIVWLVIGFIGNGFCSIFQKMEQVQFGDEGRNQFMFYALIMSFAILFIIGLIISRKELKTFIKKGMILSPLRGICNGFTNWMAIVLMAMLPVSIIYPILSAGGIALSTAVSIIFFKERLSLFQWIGVVLGAVALVLLNLSF